MFADPPMPVGTVRMRVLENISHPFLSRSHACLEKYQPPLLSLLCLPTSAFSRSPMPVALLLPSLSRYGAGECPGAVPQHERAMTRRPERPSTQRRNGSDGPRHGRTSAAGSAPMAPRWIWLPLPVVRALPLCHVAQPLPAARSLQASPSGCL
jgi:hypothetical protein